MEVNLSPILSFHPCAQIMYLLASPTPNMILLMAQKMVGHVFRYQISAHTIIFFQLPSEEFLGVYKKAQETPQKKFDFPQTEAQEIGWDTNPLVSLQLHALYMQVGITEYGIRIWLTDFRLSMQEMTDVCIIRGPILKSQSTWQQHGDKRSKKSYKSNSYSHYIHTQPMTITQA